MRGPIEGPTDHENPNPDRPCPHLRLVSAACASGSWPWTWTWPRRCRRMGDRWTAGGRGGGGRHRKFLPTPGGLLGSSTGSAGSPGGGCGPSSRSRRRVRPGSASAPGRGRPSGSGLLRSGTRRPLRAAAGGVFLPAPAGLLPRPWTSLPACVPSSFSRGFLGGMVSRRASEPKSPSAEVQG